MPPDKPYDIEEADDPDAILPEGYTPDQIDAAAPEVHDFTIIVCFEDEAHERFLMARHAERGWELPGGTIELHENPLFGALREFGEETGHRLADPEVVLQHATERGRCFVVRGHWGPAVEGHRPGADEKIEEVRFVEHLSEVEPLAWPDDPYAKIEGALGVKLR